MRNGDTIFGEELPNEIGNAETHNGSTSGHGSVINLPDEGSYLEQLEREVVVESLERNQWDQSAAERFLRIPRHTLIYSMEKTYRAAGKVTAGFTFNKE